jgi:hypothetical protein
MDRLARLRQGESLESLTAEYFDTGIEAAGSATGVAEAVSVAEEAAVEEEE